MIGGIVLDTIHIMPVTKKKYLAFMSKYIYMYVELLNEHVRLAPANTGSSYGSFDGLIKPINHRMPPFGKSDY